MEFILVPCLFLSQSLHPLLSADSHFILTSYYSVYFCFDLNKQAWHVKFWFLHTFQLLVNTAKITAKLPRQNAFLPTLFAPYFVCYQELNGQWSLCALTSNLSSSRTLSSFATMQALHGPGGYIMTWLMISAKENKSS